MSLHDQLEEDLATVFSTADFGVSVTTSTGATVNGLIDYQAVLGQYDLAGQATQALLYLRASEVPTVARYDVFTVAGVSWRVDAVLSHDSHVWALQVSTDRRAS